MTIDCLSYLFDWDEPVQLQDCFIPEMDMVMPQTDSFFFQPQPQQQFHQQPLFQEEEAPLQTFDPFYVDQFLPPQEIFFPSPKAEIFNETVHNDLDSIFPTSKRQKLVNSSYNGNTHNNFPSPNSNFFEPYELDFVPSQAFNFPEFRVPDFSFKVGRADQDDSKKPTLSSQSIAARERRRRIAEKTHELGKLIPGGHKLNTAEMFQSAAKYVKFLQSQVGILQLMQTMKKKQEISIVDVETQVLLESKAIQEKLSTEEVCLVPTEIIQELSAEETIWRNPRISREINKLLSRDIAN